MRVKCLAQEHNTMTRPGLEPGPFDLESSALTIGGVVNGKSKTRRDAETPRRRDAETLLKNRHFNAKSSKIQDSRKLTKTRLRDSLQMLLRDFEI